MGTLFTLTCQKITLFLFNLQTVRLHSKVQNHREETNRGIANVSLVMSLLVLVKIRKKTSRGHWTPLRTYKTVAPLRKGRYAKLVFWEMELQQNWTLTKPRVTMPTFSVILISL